jgi:hypothetical protein
VLRTQKTRRKPNRVDPKVANRRKQARFNANVTRRGGEQGKSEKKQRQDRFISLIAGGMKRVDATATIGVAEQTVAQWLFRDPDFKRRYVQARDKAKGIYQPEVEPFDAAFRERFFHHNGQPATTPPHMQQLLDVINEQVRIAEEEQSRDRRVLILMPPEHGKSTVAVEEYLVYRIAMDPGFRASIVCATQGKARKRLGAIARMLTDRSQYGDLIDTYGPFRSEHRLDGKPWTADYFMHLGAPANQRDYTCQAIGWTGDIYGDRNDLIVYDDIATLKNQTPAEIEKMWEKTWGEFRSRIRKGGLFIVIGTHMREGDIYSVMEEKGFFTDKVVMPAIVREPGTNGDDDPGEALWEEGTSLKELLKLREDDERMFALMYQQNPLPSVGAIFTQESIEACFNDERYIGHIPDGTVVVAGIDPSVSNYTAGVVFAIKRIRDATGRETWMRYLVDVWDEPGLTGEGGDNAAGVVEFVVELCRRYHVKHLCVENGSWMALINNSLSLRGQLYELGVIHRGVTATEVTTGMDAFRQLSGVFNHRLIDLPGSPASRKHLQTMIHQFLTYTGEKQHWRKRFDVIKAFRMAEWAVKEFDMTGFALGGKVHDPHKPAYMRGKVLVSAS